MSLPELIAYAGFAACIVVACAVTIKSFKNWQGDRYLCDDCIFNNDTDCHKTERPRALSCTVHRNSSKDEYRF